MKTERNFFLDEIGKHFHRTRPRVPEGFNSTTYVEKDGRNTFVDIYIRSKGCHHNYLGGCTMCDYWVGREFNAFEMANYGKDTLKNLGFSPTVLVFGPSGSLFDEWEVPASVRIELYKSLKVVNASVTGLFSRVETITDEKLDELVSYLDPSKISVEMGLETSDPWKLKYCINKAIDVGLITETIQSINKHKLKSSVYIMVDLPFLTMAESIDDAVSSVLWSIEQGVDYVVLFPMHLKPQTVAYWLYENGMCEPSSLWSLIEVLKRLPSRILPKIGICWHRPRPDQSHPLYNESSIPPSTCSLCNEYVLSILDTYRFSKNRFDLVNTLSNYDCSCKTVWQNKLQQSVDITLIERVKEAYKKMGISILGADWWEKHGEDVLQNVSEVF